MQEREEGQAVYGWYLSSPYGDEKNVTAKSFF